MGGDPCPTVVDSAMRWMTLAGDLFQHHIRQMSTVRGH